MHADVKLVGPLKKVLKLVCNGAMAEMQMGEGEQQGDTQMDWEPTATPSTQPSPIVVIDDDDEPVEGDVTQSPDSSKELGMSDKVDAIIEVHRPATPVHQPHERHWPMAACLSRPFRAPRCCITWV